MKKEEEEKPVKPKVYRGPPPRKNLPISPMKEKDWKGNEIFRGDVSSTSNGEEGSSRDISTPTLEVGITPGLTNGEEPEQKTPREYESDFAKLSLQGGHKDLLQKGGDAVDVTEGKRQKGCENLSEYNKIARQGGHKDILRTDTPAEERPSTAERRQKACDTENLSSYNKLAKTGGHKDLLRMDVKPEKPKKIKNNDNISEYSKKSLQGGDKDLLKLEGIEVSEQPEDRKKKKTENVSEYSKIALQGGHKDILKTERGVEPEVHRKQKGCDTDQLSKYNKLAKTGGHKNLLKMNVPLESDARRGKGCSNVSDYAKMAMQGGHKDLLVIEENKPVKEKVSYERKGGDWFEHNNNNNNNNNNSQTADSLTRPGSAHSRRPVQNGLKNHSNGILPGGAEQTHKSGKKRYDSNQRSEAPFATNW